MKSVWLLGLLAGSSILPFGAAFAQTAAAPSGSTIQEVVVTAQKRETKLETTPLTVNVISGQQLAQAGVREVKDLKASVPGLTLNESPGGFAEVSVRGIGTTSGDLPLIFHPAWSRVSGLVTPIGAG